MAQTPFVHLHNHSEFSLLDGATKFSQLADRLQELGMDAFALTDHGNLFGAVKFVDAMKKRGIKPILGCEVYVTEKRKARDRNRHHHLILLVKTKEGYKNLIKMVSRSYIEGFYYKPRIDYELLRDHASGLLGMSACLQGEIPQLLLSGDRSGAETRASFYKELFAGDFFIELQDHGIPEEKELLPELISLATRLDIPVAATNDTHYLLKEDYEAHDALLCLQTKKTFDDPKEERLSFPRNAFYLKDYDEMSSLFSYIPEALTNTLYISGMCHYALEDELDHDGNTHFPHFEVPEGHDPDTYLRELCTLGARSRYPVITEEIQKRLDYELGIIRDMGYSSYFLIVRDFIQYAKDHDIPVGPGRGSAAGSIISYTLGITGLDPLKYDLLFERFLNPERVSMPDIDVDIADVGRQDVIDYVTEKYGKNKVCQIATFGTMKARAVIRDVGRVLNVNLSKIDKLAKMIPLQAKSLEEAVQSDADLKKLIGEDDEYQKVYAIAVRLEGLSRHVSKHAAGVVIARDDLENIVPLYKDKDDNITTQFDMVDADRIGLLKIDFLGLKNLSIIADAVRRVKENRNIDLDIDDLDLEDRTVFQMLGEGKTFGIFQFESSGMREYLKKLKPERLEDLIAMNALYRPGPMSHIDTYIMRKNGREKVKYLFEAMAEVLDETYGVIVYQEQVMRLSNIIAGFTMGEADSLRKAMAKKKHTLIDEMGKKFIEGAVKKGHARKTVEELWSYIERFGEYGFNKSHSACYAYVAFQTAYLKAHFPQEYLAAQLTNDSGNAERIDLGIKECRELGIAVLPPDINASFADFSTEGSSIRYALASIKNVGRGAIDAIVDERSSNGPFQSVSDFFKRLDYRQVNRKVLEFLIYSGALDPLGVNRRTLWVELDHLMDVGRKIQENKARGLVSLFEETEGEDEIHLPALEEWRNWDKYRHEKEALGVYFSGHMLEDYTDLIAQLTETDVRTLYQLSVSELNARPFTLGGIFTGISRRISKDGKKYVTGTFEDMTAEIPFIAFNGTAEKYSALFEEETLLFVTGRIIIDEFESDPEENSEKKSLKIRLDEIQSREDLYQSRTKVLHLHLQSDDAARSLSDKLLALFLEYPGPAPVLFHVFHEDREIIFRSDSQYTVSLEEAFFTKLSRIIGKDCYHVEIKK
ncbi:MAG TPA: DNA polymerase III subunit alpha [Candidatus Mcinerneyibacteriales bacterium]|nr:DNA polymerase III subunit alpha [Candidatus Mcinerneyibacteriales bacterium]